MSDAKEPTAPEAPKTAARSRKILGWAVLFIGFGVAMIWRGLIHSRLLFQWWQPMYGRLPDALFFPLEEFFDMPDSTLSVDISWLLLFAGLLGMLLLTRGKRRWHENLVLFFVFAFQFFCLQPCLCASPSMVSRCIRDFKQLYRQVQAYGGDLPDQIPPEWQQSQRYAHEVIYHGKGRSLNEKRERFVILEDTPRSHVGDLRHRLWSDGKVESWYPWKEAGK